MDCHVAFAPRNDVSYNSILPTTVVSLSESVSEALLRPAPPFLEPVLFIENLGLASSLNSASACSFFLALCAFGEVRKAKRLPQRPPAATIATPTIPLGFFAKSSMQIKSAITAIAEADTLLRERCIIVQSKINIKTTGSAPPTGFLQKQAFSTPEKSDETKIIIPIMTEP